jgi:hypothetical protein
MGDVQYIVLKMVQATLQKQLDPYPEKESPRVEEAPQKSEIEEKEHSNQVGQRIVSVC